MDGVLGGGDDRRFPPPLAQALDWTTVQPSATGFLSRRMAIGPEASDMADVVFVE
mgnify:CR=1 FL=1